MHIPKIVGYADRFSVASGETIEFKISCESEGTFSADLVRVISGDNNPSGPGTRYDAVPSSAAGQYPARRQEIRAGSHVRVDDDAGRLTLRQSGSIHLFVYATLPATREQALIARWDRATQTGWWLGLHNGCLELRLGGGGNKVIIESTAQLPARVWYSVVATWDAGTGVAAIVASPVVNRTSSLLSPMLEHDCQHAQGVMCAAQPAAAPLFMAADWDGTEGSASGHFNGKIDAPKLYSRALGDAEILRLSEGASVAQELVAHWDFGDNIGRTGIASDLCVDVGPSALHGRAVNLPMRAATGWNWAGHDDRYWSAPEQYGAIHFHDDDVGDAGWQTDVSLKVDASLPSAVYGLRVTHGSSTDVIPFWVLPPRGTATSDILLVFPTASYMAYANDHVVTRFPSSQLCIGRTPVVTGADLFLGLHPEYGVSTYDVHSDGSGVCYSSRLRPLLTMRAEYRSGMSGSVWQFAADLHIVDWLTRLDIPFDVATDEDLDEEGEALLRRYKVALTGTHPEYVSENILNAWEDYLGSGGRVMYLGADGLYWVTDFHPDGKYAVEVRRGEAGVRCWQAAPGECYQAFTGRRGGMWRYRGRPPQKLFGVGFSAQGFDRAAPYRPLSDWQDARVASFVQGIEDLDVFGAQGLSGEGAAGYEIDRYDLSLGTPPNALLLASSDGMHSDNYLHVPEELLVTLQTTGGSEDYQVRSDDVYFPTSAGGGVFSAGSISWCGALSSNDYDNAVSKLTENVLRRFLDTAPLT